VRPEGLHLTLCFLGSCPIEEIDAIAAACSATSWPSPRGLSLAEAVWLPTRRPRVVAVAATDPHGELGSLQAALAQALQAGGWYEPEARPFRAHVTVARIPQGERVKRAELPAPEPASLDGARVALYRSRLGPGGARYEVVGG
jgi:RNA 2',3'-cyclic 3'-phosphodiesterase